MPVNSKHRRIVVNFAIWCIDNFHVCRVVVFLIKKLFFHKKKAFDIEYKNAINNAITITLFI